MTANCTFSCADMPESSASDEGRRFASPALLDPLLEEAPLMLCVVDRAGTSVHCNRRWRSFTGIATPCLDAGRWAEAIHEDDRSRCLDALFAAMRESRPADFEYRLRGADNGYHWVRQGVGHLGAMGAGTTGLLCHLVDITEQHKTAETLMVLQSRFGSLVNASPSVIYSTRAWGGFACTFASQNLVEVMGYHPEDMTNDPKFWLRHLHPDDAERVIAEFEKPLESLGGVLEYRLRHRDGHYLWIHDRHRVVYEEGGRPLEIVGTWTDISQRKCAEEQREALIAELEAKNAEMERFTYTVSHDLKSPLVTIRGFLGMLEKDAAAGNAERMRSDIARIHSATEKMQQLLDELLQLSRIGRVVNPPQRVSLGDLAREAIELTAGRASARGVHIEVTPDPPVLYGDRPRLLEVVQNLLDNALKFMGEQSEPRVEIGGSVHSGRATCFVRDNGIGVEPRYHDKIFGLFERLVQNVDGTGIGLALVKRIIEVHGGRIWIESEGQGRGSTFWFQLPLKGDDDHEHR
jgi:PAS domain S-box-containing protein